MVHYTAAQLKRALHVQRAIDSLQTKIDAFKKKLTAVLGGDLAVPLHASGGGRGMSAAGRARIAAAQRARWAKTKGKSVKRMGASARAKIAAAAKARWAKAKAAGKNRL